VSSDRVFGLIMLIVALGYIASATQIQTSFLADPVGPKTFPIIIGVLAALCAVSIILRPDEEPDWPAGITFIKLALALAVLLAYAYTLRPFGFIIPTALAAGLLSYQIRSRLLPAVVTGLSLSIGLFLIFKYALGLGLFAFPKGWLG
jgi:putative tricarboxylic transport membrane protein